ncbi:MAG: CorA family divalent cation transporter [Caulobacteraceae bacterium]
MLNVQPPHPAGDAAPHPAAMWIDLLNPEESEVRLVETLLGFKLPARDQLSGIEQSSRLSFGDGVLRMASPVVAEANTDHPHVSQIGIILTPKLMISIRYDPLVMFDSVAARTGENAPATSAAAFTAVMQAFVARQADLLEEARGRLDEVSHRVFRDPGSNTRRAMRHTMLIREKLQLLGRMGERISIIRESLLGVDRMVDFAADNAKDWFSADQHDRLRQVSQDIGALNQFEEHLLGKVQFLLDAVLGFISIEQNDIFKVLTVASVVGIFPTLVAGWYGMNFANMPEYHWPTATSSASA